MPNIRKNDKEEKYLFLSTNGEFIDKENNITQIILDYNEIIGTNYWTTKMNIGSARHAGDGFSLGGFGFHCGGNDASVFYNEVNKYNDNTETYTNAQPTVEPLTDISCSVLNDFGYRIGGEYNTYVYQTVEKYNGYTNSWMLTSNYPVEINNVSSFTLLDYIYAVGGKYSSTTYSDVRQFNGITTFWLYKGNYSYKVYTASSFTLNDRGYVVGGIDDNNNYQNSANQYIPELNIWKENLGIIKRYGSSAFTLNGFGYNCFGTSELNYYINSVEEYNDSLNSFQLKEGISITPRSLSKRYTLNGFGYVSHGRNDDGELSSLVQYRNFDYYNKNMSSFISYNRPKNIFISQTNEVISQLPVKFSSDGGLTWKLSSTNKDILKIGETISSLPMVSVGNYYDYRVQVGISTPLTTLTSGGEFWVAKSGPGYKINSGATESLNGFGYHIGGFDNYDDGGDVFYDIGRNRKYNDFYDSWQNKMSIPTPRYVLGLYSLSGFLYTVNGKNDSGSTFNTIEQYNDETNTWINLDGATSLYRFGNQTFVNSGYGYSCGGEDNDNSITTNERFDPTLKTITTKTSLTSAISLGISFTIESYNFVVGGSTNVDATVTYQNTNYMYVDGIDIWKTMTNLSSENFQPAGSSKNGFGYCIGGYNSTLLSLNANSQFNITLNSWTNKTNLPIACRTNAFSLNNFIYTSCGVPDSGALSSVYQYYQCEYPNKFTISLKIEE